MNKLIVKTLSPLNIPVSFSMYGGDKKTYITFFEYLQQGENWSDDEETEIGHYIQVDIYSSKSLISLIEQVKCLMKGARFRRTSEADLYEEDTKTYHRAIRFFYLKGEISK